MSHSSSSRLSGAYPQQTADMTKLPVELLSHIFIIVVEDEIDEYHEAMERGHWFFVNSPLILSWVCRFWRSIAHSTSCLWTFAQINITSNSSPRALHFVRLWGPLQGSITAENVSFYGMSNRHVTMSLIPRDQVKEYVYREKADDSASVWATSVVFPTARRVVVRLREKGSRVGDWTRSFQDDPNAPVQVVELYNCELSRLPHSLEEFKWSVKSHLRPFQLSNILSLPNLRHLHLCHMTFTLATMIAIPVIPPATKLTHLTLENMTPQLFRLLKGTTLPKLNRLSLFDFTFADEGLVHFITDISPALRIFDIIGPPPMVPELWKACLEATYNVNEMTIGLRGPLGSFTNSYFIQALGEPTAIPCLDTIHFYDRWPYLHSSTILDQISPILMARNILLK